MSYIKCSAGHIHDSEIDECPFCKGKTIDQALAALPPNDEEDDPDDMAMCYDMGPGWVDDIDNSPDDF